MKAVRINEFGGLDVLKWEDAPDPEPRPPPGANQGGFRRGELR